MNHNEKRPSPLALVVALVIVVAGVFALLTSGVLATLFDPDVEGAVGALFTDVGTIGRL